MRTSIDFSFWSDNTLRSVSIPTEDVSDEVKKEALNTIAEYAKVNSDKKIKKKSKNIMTSPSLSGRYMLKDIYHSSGSETYLVFDYTMPLLEFYQLSQEFKDYLLRRRLSTLYPNLVMNNNYEYPEIHNFHSKVLEKLVDLLDRSDDRQLYGYKLNKSVKFIDELEEGKTYDIVSDKEIITSITLVKDDKNIT